MSAPSPHCIGQHKPGDEKYCNPIFERLMAIVDSHINHRRRGEPKLSWKIDRSKILPVRARRRLLREVDELHRNGQRWPRLWNGFGKDANACFVWSPRIDPDEERRATKRPDNLPYCLTWYRAFWMPCRNVKERREAGYLPLQMCWPAPLPKAGSYLVNRSGRGRLAYRICEVERFDPPRGQHRYTCRLWCQRLLPGDIPKGAEIHRFYWHKRRKA